MDIRWHGGSCFSLSASGHASVWINPEQETPPADLVIRTGRDKERLPAGGGTPFTIDGPGEYEFEGVFVIGVDVPQSTDDVMRRMAYTVRWQGVTTCIVGPDMRPPNEQTAAELGEVDVLLVPLGGAGMSAAVVAELVGRFEPSIVLPAPLDGLDSDPVVNFVKEMGAAGLEPTDRFNALPNRMPEDTQVILLRQHGAA